MNQPRSAPPDLPGFTLVRGIGGGGFADVYLYNQHQPFRPVAVKVLRAEHLSEASLRQFATEADVMAQVSHHPSIVTIHTAGVAPDGRPYIVMEHYPKPHFGIRARGGTLALSETLRVGVQVASAVETAHRAGILHRDIKPANILTSEYGRPGLTDFGISAVRSSEGADAPTGVTLAYSSPEVLIDDDAGGADVSDVYSLCATLYSLLTGHSPSWVPGADNADLAVLDRVVSGTITPLSRTDVPAGLVHLLHNGLSPTPSVRPPSALALARALQSIEQELSLPPTPLEIRDDLAEAGAPNRSEGPDHEGTRRSQPQVLVIESPPAVPDRAATGPVPRTPVAPMPGAPAPGSAGPASGAARAPELTAVPRSGEASAGADTVLRRQVPTQAVAATDGSSSPGADHPRRWWLAALVALAVVAGGAGMFAVTRGRSPEPPAPTTTAVAVGPDLVLTAGIDPPTDVRAVLEPSGRLVVTFTPPEAAGAALRYRLVREDGGRPWPGGTRSFVDRPASPAVIEGVTPGERPCLTVLAVADPGARTSSASERVCAEATP